MQIDDTLVLGNNNFTSKKDAEIKVTKNMTKNQKHFTST